MIRKQWPAAMLAFITLISGVEGIYRPFDPSRSGARAAGAGVTGTGNIDSVGSLANNPAFLAEIISPRFAFGADAQLRVIRIDEKPQNVEPNLIPIIAGGFPLLPNSGVGVMAYTPYQRHFLDEKFIHYNLEAIFAHSVTHNLSLAVTGGGGLSIQADEFNGYGFAYSFSALFRHKVLDAGLLVRPGSNIKYDTFANGKSVEERFPDLIRGGVSKRWSGIELAFEVEYINWEGSSFKEDGEDVTPTFAHNYLGRFNPHMGATFDLPWFPGLRFRMGLLTEDFMDFEGNNERQILGTIGFGGLAGRDLWGEKLRIDFSAISSFVPSVISEENHRIEKLQVTFEWMY